MTVKIAVSISKCFESFKESGYTCGGCAEYHNCQMSQKDSAALAKLVKILSGKQQ